MYHGAHAGEARLNWLLMHVSNSVRFFDGLVAVALLCSLERISVIHCGTRASTSQHDARHLVMIVVLLDSRLWLLTAGLFLKMGTWNDKVVTFWL